MASLSVVRMGRYMGICYTVLCIFRYLKTFIKMYVYFKSDESVVLTSHATSWGILCSFHASIVNPGYKQ